MWIDGHLDLAYLALEGRDLRRPCTDPEACVCLPALREADVRLVLATIFTEPGGDGPVAYPSSDDLDAAEAAGFRQLDVYRALEDQGELRLVTRRAELDAPPPAAAPGCVLLMEGADPIRSPDDAASWFERGVRLVGLTWAAGTRYAGGNTRLGPLTEVGRDLVRALDELGVAHDLSHLSDDAFDGVLEIARGPVVATHSNCRALVADKQRHLRDDQIAEIGARGGIVGLNLFSQFLVPQGRATIRDCVAHVERASELMGHRRGVALGSDMDGGFGAKSLPEGLDHPTKLEALAAALRDAGWSDDEVDGFRYRNWVEFLGRILSD